MNELEIWQNIKGGDVKTLGRLHSEYFHQMCLFALKSIRDSQQVELIVSDCFLRLWENRKTIEIESSLKSYLFQILRNQIIDFYRKREDLTDFTAALPEIASEAEFDEQQKYVKLYQAISRLPDKRRKILELAVFDSLTYQQIADKLDISRNSVKTQIARSYRFLKEILDPLDFYFFCFLKKK